MEQVFTRQWLCGLGVDEVDQDRLLATVLASCQTGPRLRVCYLNAHVHNLARGDEQLRGAINSADICYADGAGIVLGCRLRGIRLAGRITAADFLPELLARAQDTGVRVFLLGGQPGVAERAAIRLQQLVPGWQPAGCQHGFLPDSESTAVVEQINASGAQLLLAGLGTPRQELWLAQQWPALRARVGWGLGATLDYFAGVQPRCPAWMGRMGLEWLHRLASDPLRLGARYLLGNPQFLWAVLTGRDGTGPDPQR